MTGRITTGLSGLVLAAALVSSGCGTVTGAAVGGAGGACRRSRRRHL